MDKDKHNKQLLNEEIASFSLSPPPTISDDDSDIIVLSNAEQKLFY